MSNFADIPKKKLTQRICELPIYKLLFHKFRRPDLSPSNTRSWTHLGQIVPSLPDLDSKTCQTSFPKQLPPPKRTTTHLLKHDLTNSFILVRLPTPTEYKLFSYISVPPLCRKLSPTITCRGELSLPSQPSNPFAWSLTSRTIDTKGSILLQRF